MSSLGKPDVTPLVVVLHGDQTGEELLLESLRVLDPKLLEVELAFQHFDLSLENRRKTSNGVVYEAAAAMRASGLGLKAATITPEEPEDVGSPNALLREAIDGKVILRVGRRLPQVQTIAGVHAPIAIVRMAVDDAYGAKEWREATGDGDQIAFRTSCISRKTCREVAEYTFRLAKEMGASVFGGPKYTVSPVYEGMFKEELDSAAAAHPDIIYKPQLIDAVFALLLKTSGEPLVIPALNRDGDLLSDMVMQMFGTIAGAESLVLAFDSPSLDVDVVMAEAPHGTAPTLQGKNLANPVAMILAGAALLRFVKQPAYERASQAIYEAVYEAIYEGSATTDLSGHLTTTEFTDLVIAKVERQLQVWKHLGR